MTDGSAVTDSRLYSTARIRELESIAIEKYGISGLELMTRAGHSAWALLIKTWPRVRKIMVVCGAGNNAGDGYVLAGAGLKQAMDISVVALKAPETLKGDALTAAGEYLAMGGKVLSIEDAEPAQADLIVDAILGTGLDREIQGRFLAAIRAINAAGKPVLALDVPSGLNADTGKVMTEAVRADVTITFIGRKQGLYTGGSAEYCGERVLSGLGLVEDIYTSVPVSAHLINTRSFPELLARRSRTAHKGYYGHVLVAGGDYGYAGAVRLCAEAAARSGAGLVSIATREEHALVMPAARAELMAKGVTVVRDLDPLLGRATVIAIGPGLGQSVWSRSLFSRVLESKLPVVVDADALNLLAQDPVTRHNWILTPHPGEAARLLGCSAADIEADRFTAAKSIQQQFGGIAVLKGSGSIVVDRQGKVSVCDAGNPGMATGGMGDILTGVIAGLLAQECAPGAAAALAVCLHAEAADKAAAAEGERGLLAGDLLPWIRRLANPE